MEGVVSGMCCCCSVSRRVTSDFRPKALSALQFSTGRKGEMPLAGKLSGCVSGLGVLTRTTTTCGRPRRHRLSASTSTSTIFHLANHRPSTRKYSFHTPNFLCSFRTARLNLDYTDFRVTQPPVPRIASAPRRPLSPSDKPSPVAIRIPNEPRASTDYRESFTPVRALQRLEARL